jgi:hypothetical protein
MEVNEVEGSLRKRKVKNFCEEERCEKCGAEVLSRIENRT